MSKKKTKKLIKKINELANHLAYAYQHALTKPHAWPEICNVRPLSKAQLAKYMKAEKARQKKEEKRRAKKITMTVGELEDRIEEAEDKYRDYD